MQVCRTIPHSIVHDSRVIDLLVRNFRDKIGEDTVRYETLNDSPSYTSNQHDVECQRRYGFIFTCLGRVLEPDPFPTQPYLSSTYPVPHIIPSSLTRYDLYAFSIEDLEIVIDEPGAIVKDNRIQIGRAVDDIISTMLSVCASDCNHTNTVIMPNLPLCGEHDMTYAALYSNDMDQDLGVFATSPFCPLDCSNSIQATAVEQDWVRHTIYTTIDAHSTSESSVIIKKGIIGTDILYNGDGSYDGTIIILRQHYDAHLFLC